MKNLLGESLTHLDNEFEKFKRGILKVKDYLFTFLSNPSVPYENNASERGVRKIKIKQKVSGCFRTDSGADDFAKLQFQVGEIIACEAVKKSKKLLCSQVKIGNQVRQIVSGIRKHYSPEEMVGKKVMVVTNLKPATLAGVKSEGMILCAEDADGNLSLMVPEKKMPAGAEIC